jgi:CRP/FNR family transcriptional regulator
MLNPQKTQITYYNRETIMKQGAFASHILFITKGLVLVFLQTDSGKKVNIRIAHPGDYLAFSALFTSQTYLYSAIALTETTTCMLDKKAVRELYFRNNDFAEKITAHNSYNERRYVDIINTISYKQMRGKLASTLLYLSNQEIENDTVFEYLSRSDIADFATISLESTVKFLKEFEKEKIISLEGKRIRINNRNVLEKIHHKG